MDIQAYYFTLTDFGKHGLAHTCDPASFDDACDALEEQLAHGCDTLVFRVEPPANGKAGMMIDVTEDAIERIRSRLRHRCPYDPLPEYLGGPTARELDHDAALGRAHKRAESRADIYV